MCNKKGKICRQHNIADTTDEDKDKNLQMPWMVAKGKISAIISRAGWETVSACYPPSGSNTKNWLCNI